MIGLVAGVLNGAAFGRDVIDFNAADDSATNTGHCIVAVDIARFVPLQTFTAEVDRHMCDLRGSRLLPGFDAIRLPGERRAACCAERAGTVFRFRRRFLPNSTNWRRSCR